MIEQRGIDADDVRWMRRDLVSSLLGVHWFGDEGRSGAEVRGRMVEAVTLGLGWTGDRTDAAGRLLRDAVADVGTDGRWADLVDRIVTLGEQAEAGVIDTDLL